MPTTPLFHLSLPDTDGPEHFAPLQIALDGLCKVNEWHITRALRQAKKGLGVPIPPLYASGVRYKEDPPGHEDWRDVYAVLARGIGDCDQLVAWRIGELRANGDACEPVLKWQFVTREQMIAIGYPRKFIPEKGVWLVHCLVRFPDGAIEDPSKILGMGGSFMEKI
jgi:hypothetical protein